MSFRHLLNTYHTEKLFLRIFVEDALKQIFTLHRPNLYLSSVYIFILFFTFYVKRFKYLIFSSSFFFSDALIGVHCTHGLNRTGYMVCRYLIQKLKWDPQKAIDGNSLQNNLVHILFYYFLLFSSFQ